GGALEVGTVYGTEGEEVEEAIGSFEMIQQMLADMATQVEAARQLVYMAARAVDAKLPNITKASAMCKLFATDTAMRVTTDAVQIFGGYGYMRDYPIEKYMRDAKIVQIYEGTNQIQRLATARNLVKEATELRHLAKYIPRPEDVLRA